MNIEQVTALINKVPELDGMLRDNYSLEDIKSQAMFMLEATQFDGFYADLPVTEIRTIKQIIKICERWNLTMGKINNIEETIQQEAQQNFWILTTRVRKTKEVKQVIFKNPDIVEEYISGLKTLGQTFITLTNEARLRAYVETDAVTKEFRVNVNALRNRKVTYALEDLYLPVLSFIDFTNRLEGNETGFEILEVTVPNEQ